MKRRKDEAPRPSAPTITVTTSSSSAPAPIPQVYTPKDLELILHLSKNTVNALLNSGQLRAVRCGRKWLIPHAAVLEFLAQGSSK